MEFLPAQHGFNGQQLMDNNNDDDLFASAMQGVTPLTKLTRGQQKQSEYRDKPKPIPRFSLQDELDALAESHADDPIDAELETGDDLNYARAGVQATVLRKLRRGDYVIQDHIDLHGMNAVEARQYVHDFLNYAVSEQMRTVRIVHGKGNHSAQGPVIKRKIGRWLRQRKDVLAYVSARQIDGGTGAVYVLLAR